jgi:uncharacterized DUF497 family protein
LPEAAGRSIPLANALSLVGHLPRGVTPRIISARKATKNEKRKYERGDNHE